ncbi:MAG TPA: hypothetical protein V6C58_16945 [Allocoleopsis sp.]
MGFKTNVTIHNLLLNNCYINIDYFIVKKIKTYYTITMYYNIYLNYDHRIDNKIALYKKDYTISIDELPDYNLMIYLYNQIKQLYNNPIDF